MVWYGHHWYRELARNLDMIVSWFDLLLLLQISCCRYDRNISDSFEQIAGAKQVASTVLVKEHKYCPPETFST